VEEGLGVVDFELDLSFAGHWLIVRKEGGKCPVAGGRCRDGS
jgi:hypothetical protein